ncbi:hypothetical protein FHL15_008557 [Xylaria flabelliformis]|uniref:Uncharacterized protein n=1 Tax=Xylaria flabelliformis TaxID=2512241 RepID=A0A553HRL2_9PEZI|nr:hypothetical protein FHL15_008557 [Xylaria flabelliformis]
MDTGSARYSPANDSCGQSKSAIHKPKGSGYDLLQPDFKMRHTQENKSSSDTGNANSDAGHPSDPATAPAVEKTPTEFLYKPATVRGLPTMIPEVVNSYNLYWFELEPFLKQLHPGVTFQENLSDDHYLIYVPRPLTKEERDKINEIRKQHRNRVAGGGQLRARVEHSPDSPRRQIEDD